MSLGNFIEEVSNVHFIEKEAVWTSERDSDRKPSNMLKTYPCRECLMHFVDSDVSRYVRTRSEIECRASCIQHKGMNHIDSVYTTSAHKCIMESHLNIKFKGHTDTVHAFEDGDGSTSLIRSDLVMSLTFSRATVGRVQSKFIIEITDQVTLIISKNGFEMLIDCETYTHIVYECACPFAVLLNYDFLLANINNARHIYDAQTQTLNGKAREVCLHSPVSNSMIVRVSTDIAIQPLIEVNVPVSLGKGICNANYVIKPFRKLQNKLSLLITESLVCSQSVHCRYLVKEFRKPIYFAQNLPIATTEYVPDDVYLTMEAFDNLDEYNQKNTMEISETEPVMTSKTYQEIRIRSVNDFESTESAQANIK